MYDLAKKARAGMKSKAERLAGEKDRKTDSSDWSPAPELNADVKTGMRPVSRRAYKDGGKVADCAPIKRADRKARKAGGRVEQKGEQPLVDRYINRDLKKANDYRDGKKHVGALKDGGRAKKNSGGSMTMEEMLKKYPAPKKDKIPLPPRRPANLTPAAPNKIKPDERKRLPGDYISPQEIGMKKGGAAKHPDIKQDKALIKKMVKSEAMKEGRAKKMDGGSMMMDPRLGIVKNKALEFGNNVVTPGLKSGGRAKKADGGSIRERFNAEFAKQRAAGAKKFTFEGKEYGTELYRPTTSPSTRGRGKTSSPDMKPSFGAPPMQASKFEGGKQDMMAYRSKGPSMGVATSKYNPIRESDDGKSIPSFVKKEFMNMDYKKNGGRIAKQIGGALGQAAGALSRGMPSAQAPMVGLPVMGGGPRPVGGMGMSRPTPMGGKQQFGGGQPMPATPMPIGGGRPGDMMATTDQGLMQRMGPMPITDGSGFFAPMPRKSGGRVARAFGGMIMNEGKPKTEGKSKSGKTNINIIIAAGSKKEPEGMVPTIPPAPMGMPPMPAPAAPAAAPMGGGMPPSAPMLGGAPSPMGGPEMPPMPMPRKDGGRITKVAKSYKDMEAGAGSGEGRLQKTDIAKRIPKPAFEKGLNLSDARGYPNKVPGATGGRTARQDGGKVYRSYKDMDAGAGSGKGRLEKTQIQSRKK